MDSGKNALRIVLAAILMLTFFLSGPRVDLDATVHPLALPRDLDSYLERTESTCQALVPGTEKKIVWARTPGEQSALALVYVHGFSASRQDTAPLAEMVARRLDANLFSTRLTGHGCGGEAMSTGSVQAWVNDLHEAMEIGRRLGRRVVLMGISTGGTLALWQAARENPEAVAALVLLSPNFGPADRRTVILTWPWGAQLAELLVGKTRSWQPVNEEQGRYWTSSYPVRALLPMMGMVKLVRSLELEEVRIPTLVVYSPEDKLVDVTAILAAFHRLGAARKLLVACPGVGDPYGHVLAGDILSPVTTEPVASSVVDFVLGLPHGR